MQRLIFILLIGSITPSISLACRCIEPANPGPGYKRAEAVMVGKVLQITPNPKIDGVTVQLEVSQSWKKQLPPSLEVVTGTSCRFPFEMDREYLLFLSKEPNGGYGTGRCFGNKPAGKAGKFLDWLKRNGKPVDK